MRILILALSLRLCALGALLVFPPDAEARPKDLKVSSPSFLENQLLPSTHTCEGENVHPTISWSRVPRNTRSIAVVLVDFGAGGAPLYRWGVINIDPGARSIQGPNLPGPAGSLKGGTTLLNDLDEWKPKQDPSYAGPCPNDGKTHRYEFRVYALSQRISLTKSDPPHPSLRELVRRLASGDLRRIVLASGKLRARYALKTSRAECTGPDEEWKCLRQRGLDCFCKNNLIAY